MADTLGVDELCNLVQRVFVPGENDKSLAVLVDLPDEKCADTPEWKQRREMAKDWALKLAERQNDLRFSTHLVLYRNPHMNNADLPSHAWLFDKAVLPDHVDRLDPAEAKPFSDIFQTHEMFMAPTQFSVTAPLKLKAKQYGFRAATMPGFSEQMIPALRIDYQEVNRRVKFMKDLLDKARTASIFFLVDNQREHKLVLDLRYRTAHASSGLFPEPGTAGNLPSGEAYIVPYEGERPREPSQSNGELPVQIDSEVVVFEVRENSAIRAIGENPVADSENKKLQAEPAYGNMAELGLGVLTQFGLQPTGQILLDEKLGLHIAFGRSDHFGGQVGASDFSEPDAVVHIDRVYIEKIQPRIKVAKMELDMQGTYQLELMRDGRYISPEG